MFLEMPPAKSSAAACGAWQGTLQGAWADRNPDNFPSIPECVFIIIAIAVDIESIWDVKV